MKRRARSRYSEDEAERVLCSSRDNADRLRNFALAVVAVKV